MPSDSFRAKQRIKFCWSHGGGGGPPLGYSFYIDSVLCKPDNAHCKYMNTIPVHCSVEYLYHTLEKYFINLCLY